MLLEVRGCRYSIQEKTQRFFLLLFLLFPSLLWRGFAGGTRYKAGGAQPCRYGIRLGAASYSRRSAYFGHGPPGSPRASTATATGTDARAHGQRLEKATRVGTAYQYLDLVAALPWAQYYTSPQKPRRRLYLVLVVLGPHTHFCRPRGLHNPGIIRAGRPGRHVSRGVWE
jgi:hypothetical protein